MMAGLAVKVACLKTEGAAGGNDNLISIKKLTYGKNSFLCGYTELTALTKKVEP